MGRPNPHLLSSPLSVGLGLGSLRQAWPVFSAWVVGVIFRFVRVSTHHLQPCRLIILYCMSFPINLTVSFGDLHVMTSGRLPCAPCRNLALCLIGPSNFSPFLGHPLWPLPWVEVPVKSNPTRLGGSPCEAKGLGRPVYRFGGPGRLMFPFCTYRRLAGGWAPR